MRFVSLLCVAWAMRCHLETGQQTHARPYFLDSDHYSRSTGRGAVPNEAEDAGQAGQAQVQCWRLSIIGNHLNLVRTWANSGDKHPMNLKIDRLPCPIFNVLARLPLVILHWSMPCFTMIQKGSTPLPPVLCKASTGIAISWQFATAINHISSLYFAFLLLTFIFSAHLSPLSIHSLYARTSGSST